MSSARWIEGAGAPAALIRAHDWAQTPLGALAGWPAELRGAVRLMLDVKIPAVVGWGPRLTSMSNESYRALMHGQPAALGLPFLELWPHARDAVAPLVERALAGEAVFVQAAAFAVQRGAHPEPAWFDYGLTPLRGADGEVAGLFATAVEATDQIRAREALATSERRLRSLVEGIPQLVWTAAAGGNWTWASPQWTAFTGQEASRSLGKGWLAPIHPEDRDLTEAAWAAAGKTGSLRVEHRIRCAESGTYRWFQTRAAAGDGDGGAAAEWLGTSTDVDERRGLARHQALLLAELQHRVRNTLSVIRSIIRRSAANSSTVEEMTDHLLGRVAAYSRVQAIVTRDNPVGIDLEELVRGELAAHAARGEGDVGISGPPVALRAKAAETLALTIHELASNSVKYGALGPKPGRLAVDWRRIGGAAASDFDMLMLSWSEATERPGATPLRRGFGFELIERTLPYELDARTGIDFGAKALRIEIEIPLTELTEMR